MRANSVQTEFLRSAPYTGDFGVGACRPTSLILIRQVSGTSSFDDEHVLERSFASMTVRELFGCNRGCSQRGLARRREAIFPRR